VVCTIGFNTGTDGFGTTVRRPANAMSNNGLTEELASLKSMNSKPTLVTLRFCNFAGQRVARTRTTFTSGTGLFGELGATIYSPQKSSIDLRSAVLRNYKVLV